MIRIAELSDVPEIVALGEKFHEEAGWSDIAGFNREHTAQMLAMMVQGEAAILLIAENESAEIVGMAGAITFPLYFNADVKCAQELFWYMKPGQRNGLGGKLLATMETEAKALGCEAMIMIALDKVNPDAIGRYYRHRGYRAAEHSWIRRL